MVGWDVINYETNNSVDFCPSAIQIIRGSALKKSPTSIVARYPRKWYKNGLSLLKTGLPPEPVNYFKKPFVALVSKNHHRQNHQLLQDTENLLRHTSNEDEGRNNTILDRRHFFDCFDTEAYLRDFYAKVEEPAMQMVLFYLPNIAARLDSIGSLLDFGAGPTIHVAICFRNKAKRIYLADYLPQNRKWLNKWMNRESTGFKWDSVLRIIATREGTEWKKLDDMENEAREKVRGVFYCDCLQQPSVVIPKKCSDQTFDIITSFFTLEYCCQSLSEYRSAIKNVCSYLSLNGTLILGGVLEVFHSIDLYENNHDFKENWCAFGGKKFSCLYITRKFVLECLKSAGMDVDIDYDFEKGGENLVGEKTKMVLYEINGMFLIVCQKLSQI